MKVPFLEVQAKTVSEAPSLREAVDRVICSKTYILGDECRAFEHELGSDLGVEAEQVVTCNSGTDAIVLGLKAMGVQAGDEVIVPAHTAVPTVAAIRALHAVPRFADVDPATWVMSVPDALSLLGPRTKAILPVHLYGNCVELAGLAGHRHLVLEDVAQAQGSSYQGVAAGSWGRAGAFSFYPTKNLGALGDGGAVVFRGAEEAGIARRLRFYGQQDRNTAELDLGVNSRLDEMQAAILRVRLRTYRAELRRKHELRELYLEALAGLPLEAQAVTPGCVPAWHLFVVRLTGGQPRDAVQSAIEKEGIGSLVHYKVPNHRQHAYRRFADRPLPHTEALCGSILSLPLHPLLTEAEVGFVADTLRKVLRG